MQTQPKPDYLSRFLQFLTAKSDLLRIIYELQKTDAEQGYGHNTYKQFLYRKSRHLTITEILDDAWNCKLIDDQQYNNIQYWYPAIRQTFPIN